MKKRNQFLYLTLVIILICSSGFDSIGNSLKTIQVMIEDGESLTFGLKKDTTIDGDWCLFDNFQLFYLGTDVPSGIGSLFSRKNLFQYRHTTERMAPNCMMKVKAFTNSVLSTPSTFWAIIMCPVDDTGRNSVSPSTIAMMTVSSQFMLMSCVSWRSCQFLIYALCLLWQAKGWLQFRRGSRRGTPLVLP